MTDEGETFIYLIICIQIFRNYKDPHPLPFKWLFCGNKIGLSVFRSKRVPEKMGGQLQSLSLAFPARAVLFQNELQDLLDSHYQQGKADHQSHWLA